MASSVFVNSLRHRRQLTYCPSMSRSVILRILRAIVGSLTPVSKAICRTLLPFSRYIFIRTLSGPSSRLILLRSTYIVSRGRPLPSSILSVIFVWTLFILGLTAKAEMVFGQNNRFFCYSHALMFDNYLTLGVF